MGKIGITELLLIFGIVVLLFGTKKLRNMGGDLGSALQSFRNAMHESEATSESLLADADQKSGKVVEGEINPDKSGTKA